MTAHLSAVAQLLLHTRTCFSLDVVSMSGIMCDLEQKGFKDIQSEASSASGPVRAKDEPDDEDMDCDFMLVMIYDKTR